MNKTIAQNNLPNVILTTDSQGAHTHTINHNAPTKDVNSSLQTGGGWTGTGTTPANISTASSGLHTHSINLNGNVAQQSLDITPRSINVNTFIYLGN